MIGSGTVLDTARLKERLGEHLEVDSRSVHAFIVGEHGDSEIAAWSSANVSGIPLHDFCEMRGHHDHEGATSEIAEKVKNSAYEIIQRKGATYYGIAMSVKRICEAIIRDERSILPISTMMDGEYGIKDVVLSMPSVGWCSKMFERVKRNDVEGMFRWHWVLIDSLEIFCDLMQHPYFGPKKTLKWMEKNHPIAFAHYKTALEDFSVDSLESWIAYIKNANATF